MEGYETIRQEKQKKSKNEAVDWKEWRQKKRENHKKWKEARTLKKLDKVKNKEKTSEEIIENIQDQNGSSGRNYTVSIAVPGSIMDNAQSRELKTYLAGQVARAAAVFNIDEIVVFDDYGMARKIDDGDEDAMKFDKKHKGYKQMLRVLQYLECPQYLRKYFFPIHSDLEFAGLLNPLDIPHHLRMEDESIYREGVVLNKPIKDGKGSFVNIGLRKDVMIDKILTPNIRVTVKLDKDQPNKKHLKGKVVSPSTPCKKDGLYWGYNVRLATTFSEVFSGGPYNDGYDVIIGTSDKGEDVDSFQLETFKHLLIVFGGLNGLETCLETDETLNVDDITSLFHHYLNTCPKQGSRIIRTEEAILITLSTLRPMINQAHL